MIYFVGKINTYLNQKPPGLPVQDSLAVFDCHVVAGAGLEPATFGL